MTAVADATHAQALASWRDGPAKRAIIDFVSVASVPGPGFVEVADRIATFDNDGTLWVEQPLPPQFDFVFRKWAEQIKADQSLASEEPYKSIIERDQISSRPWLPKTRRR
jgi:hypothetical protein